MRVQTRSFFGGNVQINSEPGFQAIKAIQEHQVYLIDEKIVSRPTMRLLMGIYEFGSKLYPELFTKPSFLTFYKIVHY